MEGGVEVGEAHVGFGGDGVGGQEGAAAEEVAPAGPEVAFEDNGGGFVSGLAVDGVDLVHQRVVGVEEGPGGGGDLGEQE